MAWYVSTENLVNRAELPADACRQIRNGSPAICSAIMQQIEADEQSLRRPIMLAVDGYKGAPIAEIVEALRTALAHGGFEVSSFNVNRVFCDRSSLDKLFEPYDKPTDPSFGRVFGGTIEDLVDTDRVRAKLAEWRALRSTGQRRRVIICHGPGAALSIWRSCIDRVIYVDTTREQIIRLAEQNRLLPLGADAPEGFPWKRIYYVEYPVLNRHKKSVLQAIDWYIDGANSDDPKVVCGAVYGLLMQSLAQRPISFKVFYMPGTFGGTEFGDRFKVRGLPNTSWDYEISVGDNHMLIDAGDGRILEMPFYNLLYAQPLRVLGEYSAATYPDHFPIAIYMQDGYFKPDDKSDFHRTHMPNHLHPDTAYCRNHFNEPLGRYETYYIVRADAGACTMHGFKDDADIDQYIADILESARTSKPFDWRKYIYEHPSSTGELHQLPPGTVHGTGGRQIILEIDTNPSRESTEYSFYLYDYCRSTYNYQAHDFTAKPLKLTLEHSLAIMRRNRRQKFMAENARPAPCCVRAGEDWREMSFPMFYNMPYQVNRLEFRTRIEDATAGLFHCLALTRGTRVKVQSIEYPDRSIILEDCDNIVLPACFGRYVCENLGNDACEIIKTFLITVPRDHIDQLREERDCGDGR